MALIPIMNPGSSQGERSNFEDGASDASRIF